MKSYYFYWGIVLAKKIYEVLVTQVCLTLCNPIDGSTPGSPVHGIVWARILDWVAIPFSRGSFWPRNWTQVSCIDYHLSQSIPLKKIFMYFKILLIHLLEFRFVNL